ncbi:Methionine--tRNA ligase [Aquicella siphonis]|uniref:Methionine--tRNA ligase n=1 Tax=Aquicella siphonis TaxID=254247 RepID=A0A5E4PGN4_9COXI|nr:methionine--tRNA ligase [Aquicella siphonis]VVC76200.1 Methionine--tRNA ligase [Aquicella siphonis]
MSGKRKILVTNALPYANGSLHLGHMVGYIQADIWVRLQKMLGNTCLYICGSDCHGTPIMIQAEKLGIAPETLIENMRQDHEKDFADFHIGFDNYYTTHSQENRQLVETIFKRHMNAGNIVKRTIKQLYDPVKNMFLPDRYIKGECPNCGAKDQYGDNCEVCGATYLPTDLKNPFSTLSGVQPVEKESEHYFFKLQNYEDFLKQWTRRGHLQAQVTNKLDEWFNDGLREWDISRDAPYFGFAIPGEKNKYFYVWLDAPVGYMASFLNLCERNKDLRFEDFWGPESQAELYHFIGKDIIYFHALFWPAMLHGAQFRTPSAIFANGFLTIDGQKMSKSRGTFIKARTYLQNLNPEYLRYYFAAKLSDRIEDLDIHFDDFTQRINSDLVGKFINIASRCASFINKHFGGKLSARCAEQLLYDDFANAGDSISECFQNMEYSHAVRQIMALADRANQYVDEKKPWALIKDANKQQEVHDVCSMGINLFRILMIYLKPVLPQTAGQAESFLRVPPLQWQDKNKPLLDHPIHEFQPLIHRIDPKQIEAMKMAAKQDIEKSTAQASAPTVEPVQTKEKEFISIDDFNKIDLRIAQVLEAESVEGADKLLRLKVDLGSETRQIFAGIKSSYQPEQLIGRQVVIVANLAPRKMRFGLSEGMVIVASGSEDGRLYIVSPENGAQPGMKVK